MYVQLPCFNQTSARKGNIYGDMYSTTYVKTKGHYIIRMDSNLKIFLYTNAGHS